MPRSASLCVIAVVLASALTACGTEPAGTDPRGGSGQPVVAGPTPKSGEQPPAEPMTPADSIAANFGWPWESQVALEYCPGSAAEHLPADLDAAEVYLCTTEHRVVPGDGTWSFAVVRRVTDADADALLAAYATPDEEVPDDAICTADLPDPRIVWVRTDVTLAVRAPQNVCGKPTAPAIAAYDSVATEIVAEERLGQINSELVDRTGCFQQWADMIRSVAASPDHLDKPGLSELPFDAIRACTYAVDPTDPVETAHAELIAGKVLGSPEQAAIRAALADSVSDPACPRTGHTRIVALWAEDLERVVYVALDGCAVQLAGSWWRATDELRALLSG